MEVKIKIPLNWKNRNYVNSIFGGSMFSAVDPIPMVQLINLLGNDYVVWDKAATVAFQRPAKETIYATFTYSEEELTHIKSTIKAQQQMELQKQVNLTNQDGTVVFCQINKTLYVADKQYFKSKKAAKA